MKNKMMPNNTLTFSTLNFEKKLYSLVITVCLFVTLSSTNAQDYETKKYSFNKASKTASFVVDGSIEEVWPLLCPIKEEEWLEGWKVDMIRSKTGIIEEDCIWTTSRNELKTIWYTNKYDTSNHEMEIIAITPGSRLVKLNIQIESYDVEQTKFNWTTTFVALNEKTDKYVQNQFNETFARSMDNRKKEINYFLKTGNMYKH